MTSDVRDAAPTPGDQASWSTSAVADGGQQRLRWETKNTVGPKPGLVRLTEPVRRRRLFAGAAAAMTAVALRRVMKGASAGSVLAAERHDFANQADTTGITGTWAFNGNGSTGSMTIRSVDSQGSVDVVVGFDGVNRQDNWFGVWDDSAKRITLTRFLPNNVIQTHTGSLGDNDPAHLILAGTFTQSDIPPNAPRRSFGWFAQWQYNIIQ